LHNYPIERDNRDERREFLPSFGDLEDRREDLSGGWRLSSSKARREVVEEELQEEEFKFEEDVLFF
jgi:hypothetical protein